MTVKSASIAFALGLTLAVLSGSMSRALDAGGGDGLRPTAERPNPVHRPSKGSDCVISKPAFKRYGSAGVLVIELQNACETRQKCTIDAYVVGSRGPMQGQGTLILAPKSDGASAGQSYTMKIRSAADLASVSHQCKSM
jgi:hypothetical protein